MAGSLDKTPNYRFDASCVESGEVPIANMYHNHPPSLESTWHENDSWELCPVIKPSVEHSRKLKTNANQGFFLVLLDLHT